MRYAGPRDPAIDATVDVLGPSAVGISALVAALGVTPWSLPENRHRRLQALGS